MALSKAELSDLLYDKFNTAFKVAKKARADLRKMTDAVSDAVITHFQEKATITVNVTTTTSIAPAAGGLQRDPVTPFTDTLGPTTTKTLPGTGTGTGTVN